jgi:hypothetical protein
MKLLVLLLFINTAYAQHVLTIDRTGTGHASSQIEKETKELVCEKLIKVLDKKKWLKVTWNLIELGSECSRPKKLEDPSLLDEALEFVGLSGELEYLHADNFNIVYEDKTEEITEQETKKLAKKNLKDKLKNKDLTLKEINELLRE